MAPALPSKRSGIELLSDVEGRFSLVSSQKSRAGRARTLERGKAGDALHCLREVETNGMVASEFKVEGKGELWPPLTRLKARDR